jgi:hypothetical protein
MLTKTLTVCFSILAVAPQADAQPKIYGKGVTIARTADVPTSPKWRFAYSRFKNHGQYNSALFVSDTNDFWHFHPGNHSMKIALHAGKITCELVAESTCSLYAISYPTGEDPSTFPSGLSSDAAKVFNGKYQRRQRKGKWGAFAISPLNSYGYSHGYATKEKATKAAIGFCTDNVEKQATEFVPFDILKFANSCKIVDVKDPADAH